MPSTSAPSIELRAASVLSWLRTEQEPVLIRAGFRRKRKNELPLPTITSLLADGTVLAEVLVQLDALPHAAVLRAPRRPASTPDAAPAVDSRQTAQLYKQNTRRVVKAVRIVLEQMRRQPLLPGAMQAYLGADVAKTPPSTNPAPCIKLVELVIAAAMYGPDSERFVWNIWHLNNATTKAVLHSSMNSISRTFNLVPFEQIVEQTNSKNSSNAAQENVLVQMGSRKFSLVTDDGKHSPEPVRDGARAGLNLPDDSQTRAPVQLVHPDHHDLSSVAGLDDDPELRTQQHAYQETNARLQEVARARALVSQLEGSVLGARGLYTKNDGQGSTSPAEAPPNPDSNVPGPLPSFTSFQSPLLAEETTPTAPQRPQPPFVSLPSLDDLAHDQDTIRLDDLPPTSSLSLEKIKTKVSAASSDDDEEEPAVVLRRISHGSDWSGSLSSLPMLSPGVPQDTVQAVLRSSDYGLPSESAKQVHEEPSIPRTNSETFSGPLHETTALKGGISTLSPRVVGSDQKNHPRSTSTNRADSESSGDEKVRNTSAMLFTSAVTAPSQSADNLIEVAGNTDGHSLDVSNTENEGVQVALSQEDGSTSEVQESGMVTSSNDMSPVYQPVASAEVPPEHSTLVSPGTGSRSGSASPGLPPLFLTMQKTREENLNRVAAGMRPPSATPPPSSKELLVPEATESSASTEQKERLASGIFASYVAKFDAPATSDHPIGFPYGAPISSFQSKPGVEEDAETSEVDYEAEEDVGSSHSSGSYEDAHGPNSPLESQSREVVAALQSALPSERPSTPQSSANLGECPKTPPSPPKVSDVVASFAVKSSDRPSEKSSRVVSTMSPSPKLFQKLLSVWKVTDEGSTAEERGGAMKLEGELLDKNMGGDGQSEGSPASGSERSEGLDKLAEDNPVRGGRRRAVRMVKSPLQSTRIASPELTRSSPSREPEIEGSVVLSAQTEEEKIVERPTVASSDLAVHSIQTEGARLVGEPSSSEVTNEVTTSSSSVERRMRSAKTSSTLFTETQVQRFSQESHEGMSPVVHDSPNTESTAAAGDGIEIDGGSVRVDKRRLDWLTQELLAARDAINKKNLELHMTEKDKNDEKEVLILEKQDAESVVSAMKQILAEREGELREARRRLSIAISGVSKRKVSARNLTSAEVKARIEVEASRKAEVIIKERTAGFDTASDAASRSPAKVSEFYERLDQSDALTKQMAENSQAEMNRLWGEVQTSMEEKMMEMVDRRDAELTELKRELAGRQKAMDDLQEARVRLVNQNAHIQAEATSAKQERELIITQAAMEISQVQAQLVLVDKFSKKLHETFKETEMLRVQVADSQAKMASITTHNGISAREAKELRETVLKAQAEVDRWKEVAELAKWEKMEAVNRAEEMGRLYQESAARTLPQEHYVNAPSDGSGSASERSYEHQEPTVVRHGSSPSLDQMDREAQPRVITRPAPPEPKASSRMWASIKNMVTGRKPPRKPRDRRARQPATPVVEDTGVEIGPAIPAPYSSPQLHARDFVQSYRHGDAGIPSPPRSDYSEGDSVQSPQFDGHERERQISV